MVANTATGELELDKEVKERLAKKALTALG